MAATEAVSGVTVAPVTRTGTPTSSPTCVLGLKNTTAGSATCATAVPDRASVAAATAASSLVERGMRTPRA
ncbi:hypothetical protein ACFFSW_05255 [Saccharothrix longispora]|uniref:Uncharacterized protein n=1 Tax=Saccharothrix longispora TaxID=33920 RepID=A0ABU1PRD9_9PSEU|nr:hypothetical protein [Saccharothrix longispora]MDR6593208.1 hypothetical protein [Saccharothrix longispora]